MLAILQAGPAGQNLLMRYLDDHQIADQIIILLGGIGDETTIEPIMRAMPDPDELHSSPATERAALAANLALTNITQAEVIWHHGGGITVDRCPEDPKSCWYAWWIKTGGHLQSFS